MRGRALTLLLLAGCAGRLPAPTPGTTPGPEAGPVEVARDAGAARDSGVDAGPRVEAGPDAGCAWSLVVGAAGHVGALGAAQGLEVRDGRVYLFGDSVTGIVREAEVTDAGLALTGRDLRLTVDGGDRIPHPTGLTVVGPEARAALLGNTVGGRGTLFFLDWDRALTQGSLEGAILHVVVDEAAVNGTRPERVVLDGRPYFATSDYGSAGNEVRLYDPVALLLASSTAEPGVVAARFDVGPFVQSLHFLADEGALVLVQNSGNGVGWVLTVVDLAASVAAGEARELARFNPALPGELEGFHRVDDEVDLFVAAASPNHRFGRLRCEP